MKKKKVVFFSLLVIVFSLFVGATSLSFENLLTGEGTDRLVLLSARVPRTIAVLLAGSSLALSGMVMQTVTQNRFASPDTVGTLEAAKLGLLVSLLFIPNASVTFKMTVSFLFALVGSVIFMGIIRNFPLKNQLLIPLLGVMFGNIIGGFATFIAYRFNLLQNLTAWTQGNFSLIIDGQYEWIYATLILFVALYFLADYLTVTRFGRDAATSLGVSYRIVTFAAIAVVSIAVAVILVVAGNLPFIGVIIPNIISMQKGDHVRKNQAQVAAVGAIFLLVCDVISRVIILPYEVPVSLILGIIGGGYFLFLLGKQVTRRA